MWKSLLERGAYLKEIKSFKTLCEFWCNANGIYDFYNRDGEVINDMDYPLETVVLSETRMTNGCIKVTLDV